MAKKRIPRYQLAEVEAKKNKGRVPVDASQLAPNNSYSPPSGFYEDKPFTCVDCGKEEVWTAEQQKWWYEVAKGPIYSTAIRCRPCRKARRDAESKQHDNPLQT
jgi:hypothetical protein